MVPGEAGPIFEHPIGRETFCPERSDGDGPSQPQSVNPPVRPLHQIDNGLQRYALRPEEGRRVPERARRLLRACLAAWERRGYRTDKRDIVYARDALRCGDEFAETLTYEPSPPHAPFVESDLRGLEKAIRERRPIRLFSDKDVPDELLDKVLEAALWAPNACSLGGVRFIVVKRDEGKKMMAQVWRAPVIILAGFDERPYRFIKDNELPYNPFLDVGAAVQNMLLMAHALGLGAAWATFAGELSTIRRELNVPDHIKLITYVVMGWPADNPRTVPRIEVQEVVCRERWSAEA